MRFLVKLGFSPLCAFARRAHRYTCCDEANRRSQALRRGAGETETRLAPRTRQLIISLIVACAMFMQNFDCKTKTHARDEGYQATEVLLVFDRK